MNHRRGHDVAGGTPPYTVRRSRQQMVRDVRRGLTATPKELSPKYFYDERGSDLFEQITELPEYYLTRAERALLESVIGEIVALVKPCSLVELGAGSASKTRLILDAMRAQGCAESYVPIDVSRDFLEATALQLKAEYPEVSIVPVVSDIAEPFTLPELTNPTLVAFLGMIYLLGARARLFDACRALVEHRDFDTPWSRPPFARERRCWPTHDARDDGTTQCQR